MKTTRRQFLRKSAGTAGALAVSRNILIEPEHIPTALESAVPASDRLRFGMIGVGMQGSGLLANAVTLAGVECGAGACGAPFCAQMQSPWRGSGAWPPPIFTTAATLSPKNLPAQK